ncbi:MAG: type II CAAX endopeptidase family protein [Pseudomonadota bacterium]
MLLRTPAFENYILPARDHPQIWRLILGVLLLLLVYAAFIAAMGGAIFAIGGMDGLDAAFLRMSRLSQPADVILVLTTFVGLPLGAVAAARLLHRRRAASLFGPGGRALTDFLRCTGVTTAVYAPILVLWFIFNDAQPGLPPSTWLLFLPATLLGLLVQTGAEEPVFRGYLQQQFAARFASPIFWMILPSIGFGMLHFDPATMGANAWLIVAATGIFGLLAADLTAQSGSIGAAWGLHFANNFFALAIIAVDDTITGLALYRTPYGAADPEISTIALASDAASLLLAWALCRRVVRR